MSSVNQASAGSADAAASHWRGRKVLVSGAGGFIGSHLCEALVRNGAEVRALIRYSSHASRGALDQADPQILRAIEVVAGDVTDAESVRLALRGCTTVFHLAALCGVPYSYEAPRSYLNTNIGGTFNILEAARQLGLERLVVCSTSEVYGSAQRVPVSEDHPLRGQSPYAASKIAAEKLAESFYCSFGTPVVIVRPFNTFGPRQSARAILPSIILQALHGPEIQLGNLTTTRDLTFVTDTCAGLIRAGETEGIDGLTCNLGFGKSIAIGELARLTLARLGFEKSISQTEARIRPVASEVQDLRSDNRLARERLGWEPAVTLGEGLDRTIAFYRKQPEPARVAEYAV